MVAKNSMPVMLCVFGSLILGIVCIPVGIISGFWIYLAVDLLSIVLSVAILIYFSHQKAFSME